MNLCKDCAWWQQLVDDNWGRCKNPNDKFRSYCCHCDDYVTPDNFGCSLWEKIKPKIEGEEVATYCFVCPDCGEEIEIVRPMSEAELPLQCRTCKQEMRRDYSAESVNAGDKEYFHPIHSDSLAIMPSQVEEHRKKFPDVPLDGQCRPVFTSYKQHDKYLEKTGFAKQRQRIRKKGRKIK
jgi:putative FmdB family regulatory protein